VGESQSREVISADANISVNGESRKLQNVDGCDCNCIFYFYGMIDYANDQVKCVILTAM
jgi:hypothetical protein